MHTIFPGIVRIIYTNISNRLLKDIDSNKEHLNSMKDKTAIEWRNYATQCMIEILDHKTKS